MSIFSTPGVCFQDITNRRRFNYSGVPSHGESSRMASSSIGCDKPDRFLPTLTSNMPLNTPSETSRYAELLARVDPPPGHSGASSDPTLLSRLYYSQSLNVNVNAPVPSPYSALRNVSSGPAHVIVTGHMYYDWPLHPCAWSCQNVIATILPGTVYTYTCKDRRWDVIKRSLCMATSLEWLNDHTLVIGDVVGTVVVKDLNTGQETRKWDAPDHLSVEDASISSLSFSRERHTIAAGHWGGDLTLYDPRADKPGKYLPGWLPSGISTVRWNPEGRYLAAGGPKGDVVCMGVEADKGFSLRLPNQKRPHKAYSTSLAWGPWDPYLLATGGLGNDGMVHLWSLSSSDKSSRPYRHSQTSTFPAQVTSIHFSPHVREMLLTYGSPHKDAMEAPLPPRGIVVHQYPSFKRVHAVNAHKSLIVDSVLSADGTSLLTYGQDGTLETWKIWGERKKERSLDRWGIR